MAYTNSDLLEQIKQRTMLPTNQNTWTDARLLALATEVARMHIVPLISQAREGFFHYGSDDTLTSGRSIYPINARAVGQVLIDLELVQGDSVTSMGRIRPEEKGRGESRGRHRPVFYLKWNDIVLPDTSLSGTLRQTFLMQHPDLIPVSSAGRITVIDTATSTVSVDVVPSGFTVNAVMDFIRGDGGHEYRGIDQTITGVSGLDVTFASLPDGLAVGDYLALKGESPIAMLPDEFQTVLIQRCVVQINETGGYMEQRGAAMDTYREMVGHLMSVIQPRVKDEVKVAVSNMNNRGGYY